MSYIGQRPVVGRYIKLDQISSGFNGSNTGFSMTAGSQAVFPGTARNLLLSLGGVIQEPDTDFTISGSTLTFTTPPVANTTFFGVIYGDMQATGTPSDGTVLPASIASSGNFSFPQLTVTSSASLLGGVVFNENGADVDFRVEGDTEANLLVVDASADKVGIGTSSPGSVLHVDKGLSGSPLVTFHQTNGNSSADAGLEVETSSTGTYIQRWVNSGSEKMRVTGNGNVGIGTVSPSSHLEVVGGTGVNLLLNAATHDASTANQARLQLGFVHSGGQALGHIRLDEAAGNSFDGILRLGVPYNNQSGGSSTREVIEADFNGNICFPGSTTVFDTTARTNGLQLYYETDSGIATIASHSSGGNTRLDLGTNSSGGAVGIGMTIRETGNVGIGTTSPNADVDIATSVEDSTGTLSAHGIRLFHVGATDEEVIPITGGFLSQVDRARAGIGFISQISGSSEGYGGAVGFYTRNTADGNGLLRSDERMRIDSSGKVGIGTTSPIGTLDVHDGTFVLSKPSSSGNERNYRFVNNNAAAGNLGLQVSTAAGGSTFSNLVELSSGGRLMIGTTTIVGSSRTNTPGLQIKGIIGNAFDNHIYLEGASTNGNADTGAALGFGGHDGSTARNWAQICGKKENGTSSNTSSYMSFATRRSGVSGINEKYRITSMGSLTTAQSSQSVIGRDWTSGSVAAGTTVNWNGSGADAANSKLNFNSIGGNGGGHITCLSVSSQDQNPSGAMIVTGVHGAGFNTYVTHASNFDSGISVTFNGTVTIQNTSSETIYYAVNVIHLGTGNTTYLGR